MLENLNAINWQSLDHAYGEASDVPDLIRALASRDEETRQDALYALYGNIWHQGTVYEATSYAVPFLLELLADDGVQGKEELRKNGGDVLGWSDNDHASLQHSNAC